MDLLQAITHATHKTAGEASHAGEATLTDINAMTDAVDCGRNKLFVLRSAPSEDFGPSPMRLRTYREAVLTLINV